MPRAEKGAFAPRTKPVGALTSRAWTRRTSVIRSLSVSRKLGPGCRATTRGYFIRAQFGTDETIYQSPVGKAFLSVIVSPDEEDETKWVLRAMYDLCVVE